MLTIDIDTGGTMTDALITDGAQRYSIKVDTTPHDYTVSFLDCLREAAKLYEVPDLDLFLQKVRLIRWSSTITTNVLAERRGARVGLLVSEGCHETLYGEGRSAIIDELVPEDSVIGLPAEPSSKDILLAVKQLLESGVRRICVALKDAFPDNQREVAIKRIIEAQYPDHIIGSVPVLLGSDMAQIGHDQTRAHYSAMNAYTHTHLATSLFKAEDLLRDQHGWNRALLIGQTNGGVARIGKTKAVDTIESGPVFGTFGGAFVAREYGIDNVVCFDVGGTTTKCSIVRNGEPVFQRGGLLMEVPVKTSFAMLRSAALGGGSIARARDGRIALGPDSQGATPGPACYALGGREATLTDALLLLGYLDADSFLGGRRSLSRDNAHKVIQRRLADPLGISVDEAALAIRDEAVSMMCELITSTLEEAGLRPAEAALFAFGGNGPMFGCFVAARLGIQQVYAFDFGPVFGAFGSSVSEVSHRYERGIGLPLEGENHGALIRAAERLCDQAWRDLAGEGFDPAQASFVYELELGRASETSAILRQSHSGPPDAALLDAFAEQLGDNKDPIQLMRLQVSLPVDNNGLQKRAGRRESAKPGGREMKFTSHAAETRPAHAWEQLNIGDEIAGPAVINGATLTCPVPPGWTLRVDDYGNAAMRPDMGGARP